MFKNKLKTIVFTSLVVTTAIPFALSVLTNANNQKVILNNEQKNNKSKHKLVEILEADVIGNSTNKQTPKSLGVKRFDIIFKANNEIDLKSKLKIIANKYLKIKEEEEEEEEDLVFILGKYLKTISIAITNNQDYDAFKNALSLFAYDDNEVSSVYGFKSSYTYEDFVLKKKNNSGVRTTSNQEDKRHNVGSAFDLRPYANNDELFSLVGLT